MHILQFFIPISPRAEPKLPEQLNIIGRLAGVDYGRKRIGMALTDYAARIVSPAGQISAAGNPADDARRVALWGLQLEVQGFVVGLPLNMDGSEGPQARLSRAFAAALADSSGRPVELWDERLSSFQADALLDETALGSAARKRRRDAVAAQVILQSFLASRASPPPEPETE